MARCRSPSTTPKRFLMGVSVTNCTPGWLQAPRPRRRAKRPTLMWEYPRSHPISRRGKSQAADQRTPTGRRIRRAPWCRLFLRRADVALELAMKIVGAEVLHLLRQVDRANRLTWSSDRAAVADLGLGASGRAIGADDLSGLAGDDREFHGCLP